MKGLSSRRLLTSLLQASPTIIIIIKTRCTTCSEDLFHVITRAKKVNISHKPTFITALANVPRGTRARPPLSITRAVVLALTRQRAQFAVETFWTS